MSDAELQRQIDRCRREIAELEAQLRAGNPEVEGLCLALSDWSMELRILERRQGLLSATDMETAAKTVASSSEFG